MGYPGTGTNAPERGEGRGHDSRVTKNEPAGHRENRVRTKVREARRAGRPTRTEGVEPPPQNHQGVHPRNRRAARARDQRHLSTTRTGSWTKPTDDSTQRTSSAWADTSRACPPSWSAWHHWSRSEHGASVNGSSRTPKRSQKRSATTTRSAIWPDDVKKGADGAGCQYGDGGDGGQGAVVPHVSAGRSRTEGMAAGDSPEKHLSSNSRTCLLATLSVSPLAGVVAVKAMRVEAMEPGGRSRRD